MKLLLTLIISIMLVGCESNRKIHHKHQSQSHQVKCFKFRPVNSDAQHNNDTWLYLYMMNSATSGTSTNYYTVSSSPMTSTQLSSVNWSNSAPKGLPPEEELVEDKDLDLEVEGEMDSNGEMDADAESGTDGAESGAGGDSGADVGGGDSGGGGGDSGGGGGD